VPLSEQRGWAHPRAAGEGPAERMAEGAAGEGAAADRMAEGAAAEGADAEGTAAEGAAGPGVDWELLESIRQDGGFWLHLGAHREAIVNITGLDDALGVARVALESWKALPDVERSSLRTWARSLVAALSERMPQDGPEGGQHEGQEAAGSEAKDARPPKRKLTSDDTVKAGKRPGVKKPTAWGLFMEENRAALEEAAGSRSCVQVSRAAGERWKALSAEQRADFETRAAALRGAQASSDGAEAASANAGKQKKAAGAPPAKARASHGHEIKQPQATQAFKGAVLAAVREYIQQNPSTWSKSMMQEELAEQHGWTFDKHLDIAIKAAIKDCGFEGLGAGVPKAVCL